MNLNKIWYKLFPIVCFCCINIMIYSQNKLQNLADKGFDLDINFFNTENNFAKFGVKTKDGFLISGQNFIKENNIQRNSAIVKLSNDGKIIKKTFLGSDFTDENGSSIKTLFDIGNDRFLQVGEENKKLWLREINDELDVLKDSVYVSVPAYTLYSPYVFNFQDKILVITKSSYLRDIELNITTFNNDLKIIDNSVIKFPEEPFNFCEINDFSCVVKNIESKLYLTVNACTERRFNTNNKNNSFLIEYDLNDKKVTNYIAIDENFVSKKLIDYNDKFYIVGEQRDASKEVNYKNVYKKTSVKIYSKDLKKIGEFNFDKNKEDNLNEIIYDALIANNQIQIVGESLRTEKLLNECFYLSFDLNGKLLEKRTFIVGATYLENWIRKIVPLENNKVLLLGKGNTGWRIIIK